MGADQHRWPAPTAAGPVTATVQVPGSKSMTNRALVLASLASGPGTLRGALEARDTLLMQRALRSLGVSIDGDQLELRVTPAPLRGGSYVDCGLAGTVMRFVPPVAALAEGDVRFDGDPRARVRPMRPIIDALEGLGAVVDDGGRGTLPFTVAGRGAVRGGEVELDSSASSQFISGLLLAAARYDEGLVLHHDGGALPSLPHLEMTVAMLRERGVQVDADTTDPRRAHWSVRPGPITPIDAIIEPDLSNAAPFLAAAMVTAGTVTIPAWPTRTTQPGAALPELLQAMGGSVRLDASGLTITGPARLSGLDADLHAVGELTPVLAALCALATTPSSLRGIAHLRGHETDRLAALARELTAMGATVTETDEGLEITPSTLRGTTFQTYDDHRMATAGAVLGLVVPQVEVVDIATTGKSLPRFTTRWDQMLGRQDAAA